MYRQQASLSMKQANTRQGISPPPHGHCRICRILKAVACPPTRGLPRLHLMEQCQRTPPAPTITQRYFKTPICRYLQTGTCVKFGDGGHFGFLFFSQSVPQRYGTTTPNDNRENLSIILQSNQIENSVLLDGHKPAREIHCASCYTLNTNVIHGGHHSANSQ